MKKKVNNQSVHKRISVMDYDRDGLPALNNRNSEKTRKSLVGLRGNPVDIKSPTNDPNPFLSPSIIRPTYVKQNTGGKQRGSIRMGDKNTTL